MTTISHANARSTSLNGVCPYFTMFPLAFPLNVLTRARSQRHWVLDPFSGRGTTALASRVRGLPSCSVDSNPVASALSQAKLIAPRPSAILRAVHSMLEEVRVPKDVPDGPFWRLAFNSELLVTLCRLREALLANSTSASRIAARAILLGALHGPRTKGMPSYCSNQSPRTYAPKPTYAVRYWRKHKQKPPRVELFELITRRAERYYGPQLPVTEGAAFCADSRQQATFARLARIAKFHWIITSPPYYGMRTYMPDQWLRLWFLGGPEEVGYSQPRQLSHLSPSAFAAELRTVWQQARTVASDSARLVIRFGGINDRLAEPSAILRQSLCNTGWRIRTIRSAGFSSKGKRQALHFMNDALPPKEEYDLWAEAW